MARRSRAYQILTDAADLIEQNGLAKETFVRRDDGVVAYCAIGALRMAAYGSMIGWRSYSRAGGRWRSYSRAVQALAAAVGVKATAGAWSPIADWNDRKRTKASTVVFKLREAAATV